MRKSLAIALVVLVLGACGASPSPSPVAGSPSVTAAATPRQTPSPVAPTTAPTATPEPTPTPTEAPPGDVVRVRLLRVDTKRVQVEVRDPSLSWGLIRAGFEVTLLDKAGTVLGVEGNGGLPGASCCTIYQLGPGETYPLDVYTPGAALKVASVEVRTIGDWLWWPDVAAAQASVVVSGAHGRIGSFVGATKSVDATGRVTVSGAGPFNVQVLAYFEGTGKKGFWITDVVSCVKGGRAYAFDISDLLVPPAGSKLKTVRAITTTVPGFGDVDQPPGC